MDWWRQWVDLNFMTELVIFIRPNALWIVFMIRNDGNLMSHTHQKREYDSFHHPQWNLENLDFLFRFLQGMQDSTDRRIGPNFKSGIHGPLNRSEFLKKDPRTAGRSDFWKRDVGIRGPLNRSEFLKGMQEPTDRRIGLNLWRRIHGPLNRFEFLKQDIRTAESV